MSYDDVRRIEQALVKAMKALPHRMDFTHNGVSGDHIMTPDIVGYERGRPLLPQINLTRVAEIMESELS